VDLKEMATASLARPMDHWYYRTKRISLRKFFRLVHAQSGGPLDVVDIGAGSGTFSEDLATCGGPAIRDIVRVDTAYTAERTAADSRLAGGVVREQRSMPERIEGALVLLMDVLEHVEDDRALLRSVVASCRGPNYFFLTAPAFQSLWSGHDEFLGHRRRYTLRSLGAVARDAGLQVTAGYYIFGSILPLVWALRRLPAQQTVGSQMKPVHPLVNQILTVAGRFEGLWTRWNRLAGLTVVIEGRVGQV
jgi:hypothetical protein